MKFKKTLGLSVLAAALLLTTGCGPKKGSGGKESGADLSGEYTFTVWVGESIVDLTKKQIADFVAANEGIKITADVTGVTEADSATKVLTDIDAAADLYCFAQDQFARLVQGGALSELGKGASQFVAENNDGSAVAASKAGDKTYAYPITSDNGYFMYYDKSVITDESHLGDLELLLADCKAANRNFSMEFETSGWYLASWFFGAGCHSNWTANDQGKFVNVDDDFNSDKGLLAAKAAQLLTGSGIHVSSHSVDDFDAATKSAIVVDGTWDYKAAKDILGDNLGAAPLPSVKVGEETFHLGSFSWNKLLGVKPNADAKKLAVAHKLAQYLSGEAGQKERFEAVAWGPSNVNVQKLDEVKENPALAALLLQNEYAVPQGQIHGSWWDIATALGAGIKAAKNEDELRAALKSYDDAVKECVTDKEAQWGLVGSMEASGWSTNINFTKQDDGTYVLDIDLAANDEFKVRDGSNWDSFNDLTKTLCEGLTWKEEGNTNGNILCTAAGNYHFVLDDAAKTLVVTVNA